LEIFVYSIYSYNFEIIDETLCGLSGWLSFGSLWSKVSLENKTPVTLSSFNLSFIVNLENKS
jgi:hypothetical protein